MKNSIKILSGITLVMAISSAAIAFPPPSPMAIPLKVHNETTKPIAGYATASGYGVITSNPETIAANNSATYTDEYSTYSYTAMTIEIGNTSDAGQSCIYKVYSKGAMKEIQQAQGEGFVCLPDGDNDLVLKSTQSK